MINLFKKITDNWKSGLSVSLVSIPLAVSLAIASNTTPTVGLVTAVWAGFTASLFAGSNFNIIGPTGALSGILAAYAFTHGASSLPLLAILSGLFIFVAYIFKLEKYLVFFPSSTIHGFVLGVACIISFNQLNSALGLSNLPLHERFLKNVLETCKHINQTSIPTLLFFLSILILLFVLKRFFNKIPGIILMTPVCILIGFLSSKNLFPIALQTLDSKFPNIKAAFFVNVPFKFYPGLLVPAIAIAIIGIIETMISARIADGITKTKHNKRKEIFSLGLANVVSGLCGGIPATAALARTALNIKTGATHKISATICSIFILLISFLLIPYFKYLPVAAVAAILVFVSIGMIEKENFARMYQVDKKNFLTTLFVAGITVYEDPIIGILIGGTISMLLFMVRMSEGQFELAFSKQVEKTPSQEQQQLEKIISEPDTLIYSIKGQLAYINAQSHIARFDNKPTHYKNVILDLKDLFFIDLDGVDALLEIIHILQSQQKAVFICGINAFIKIMLDKNPEFKHLKKQGIVLEASL